MITFDNVGLVRRTREEFSDDLKARLFALAAGQYKKPRLKTILSSIDLTIRDGEKVGIIGPNGAGKSTLLKLICRVLVPTSGRLDVSGRVAPLLELGAGFDPELSVRHNIVLYGVLLGLNRQTVDERAADILRFAELEEYVDYPVSALSSGMTARLGFAIATAVDADILLIDEALSVGDERFRARSRARIDDLWHEHRTIIIVSHELSLVRTMCERAIWLDDGRIAAIGPPNEVVDRYVRSVDEAAVAALLRARG